MYKSVIDKIISETITKHNNLVTKCPRPSYISRPSNKDQEFISKFFNDTGLPRDSLDDDYIDNYIDCGDDMSEAERQYNDDYNRLGQERIENEVFTNDEKNSKMVWSGSNYVDVNYYAFNVRGDNDRIEQFSKFHDVDRLESIVSNLESAIDKSVSIDKNRHLYRYDGDGLGFDVREGEVVTLKGFQSTTYDKSLVDNSRNYNDEIMEEMGEPKSAYVKDIYVPKGIKGMMMGGEECEYLLPPNTRLYCFSIDKENRRAKFIVLPT